MNAFHVFISFSCLLQTWIFIFLSWTNKNRHRGFARSAVRNVVQNTSNCPACILSAQCAAGNFVRVRSLDARCFLVLSELFISYIFSEYPGNDICSFNFLRLYNSDDLPCSFCFLNGVASSSSCVFLESFFTFNR